LSGIGLAGALALCVAGARGGEPPPAAGTEGSGAPPAPPGAAERGAPAPLSTRIIETTTSELVLIELYVRDKDGRPVRDLTPADVVLRIDQSSAPKPIVSLEWIEPPPALTAASGAAPGAASQGQAAEDWTPPPSPSRRDYPRRFLLFFDDSTSSYVNMTNARRAAMNYLSRPGPTSDQYSVAVYDERRKLSILHDFTSDRAEIVRAIEASLGDPLRQSDYADERDARIAEIDRLQSEADQSKLGGTAMRHEASTKGTSYAGEDASRMGHELTVMRTLVDALAPWPGYKALVFVGDGITENPAFDYGQGDPHLALTAEIGHLGFAAAGSNVTLHSVQTSGAAAGTAREMAASRRRSNVLTQLAVDTGGVARSTNDLAGAFDDVQASAEGYYVLSYAPEGPPDGKVHSVRIQVKRKNMAVRFRRSFTRFTPSEARERAVEAAYIAPELHHELGLDLVAVAGPPSGRDRLVDLVLYVPAGQVLFLPEPGGAAARLEVGLVALDGQGRETLRIARRVRVAVDATRAVSGGPLALDFYTRVKMPATGGGTVTAVLADVQSGTIGSAKIAVPVPDEGPPEVVGLSLYSMEERSLWLEVDPRASPGGGEEVDLQHTVGPALRSRFVPGETVECGFRIAAPPTESGGRVLHLQVRRGEEVVRRRAIGSVEGGAPSLPAGGQGTLRADVPVAGLADGDYTLCIEEERQARPVEIGRLSFRIVPRPRI
jgi:VWFA-related protein